MTMFKHAIIISLHDILIILLEHSICNLCEHALFANDMYYKYYVCLDFGRIRYVRFTLIPSW